jgi:hypothetical protein
MEEVKELNWWIKATQHIRSTLKPHIEEYNSKNTKKLSGTVHVSVAKALKTSGLLSSTLQPNNEDILKTYNSLLPEPQAEPLNEPQDDKVVRLSKLLEEFFDGETTEIIIRKPRRGCWC